MNLNPVEIRTLVHVETRRTGSPVYDEDLVQEIALRAWEATRRIKHVTHPRALLAKIVRDAIRDRWRRRRPCEDLASVDDRFISHLPQFECDIDTQRQLELLHRSLAHLSESKRVVLELFYLRDHSIRQIAELQNRSLSAVKMELRRSRCCLAGIMHTLANKKSR